MARHAGFCFGVRRAVETAERSAPAVTLGPIIHNPQVVEQLARRGVRSAGGVEAIPSGARVIIRSHGVGREAREALAAKDCEIVDATCPFVERIHDMARAASRDGAALIVIGEAEHPEVQGILGWTDSPAWAVMTAEDVESLPPLTEARVVAQTTMVEERFREICALLQARIPKLEIHATICTATRDRQREVADIASKADAMIIIGGRRSATSLTGDPDFVALAGAYGIRARRARSQQEALDALGEMWADDESYLLACDIAPDYPSL